MSQLLVYERKPRRAAILARVSSLDLRQVRSLTQLRESMAEVNPTICAIEISRVHAFETIELMHAISRNSRAPIIAMPEFAISREWPWLTPVLYEAGATAVFSSMLESGAVVDLIRRCVAKMVKPSGDTQPIRAWTWSRLPWKRLASDGLIDAT